MAEPYDSAEEKILSNIAEGVKNVRYSDGRQVEFITDPNVIEQLRTAQASKSSPFVRVGFTGRPI